MSEYIVSVKSNPEFCGEGAGGAQFAHGKARITDKWLAEWFRSHEGYAVEDVAAEEPAAAPEEPAEDTAKAAKSTKAAAK